VEVKMTIFAPYVLALGVATMLGSIGYDATRPPMDELHRFIRYETPDETDAWVRWQRQGSFSGHESEQPIGRGLILVRDRLHLTLVEGGQWSEAEFAARYGAADAPDFCALSKEAIAMSFGSRESVWKYSRC
jgi:hypothetical protein